jgi:hypothetical protein
VLTKTATEIECSQQDPAVTNVIISGCGGGHHMIKEMIHDMNTEENFTF